MADIIRRESEGKTIQAKIQVATVLVTALCSDDVVPKLNLPGSVAVWLESAKAATPEGELPRIGFEAELPVLGFNEELLYVDGYMAGRLLQSLQAETGELWFIFGSFLSQNGKRYYIVLPRDQVPKRLAVLNWEILGWTKKEIHQF